MGELQRAAVIADGRDPRRRGGSPGRRLRVAVAPRRLIGDVVRPRGRHRRHLGDGVAVLRLAVGARRLQVGGLDVEDEVADVDLVVGRDDLRSGELPAVHVRAVGGFQIEDDDSSVLDHDPGVLLGNVALGQADVVLVDAPDGDLFRFEVEPLGGSALLGEDDAERHLGCPSGGASLEYIA